LQLSHSSVAECSLLVSSMPNEARFCCLGLTRKWLSLSWKCCYCTGRTLREHGSHTHYSALTLCGRCKQRQKSQPNIRIVWSAVLRSVATLRWPGFTAKVVYWQHCIVCWVTSCGNSDYCAAVWSVCVWCVCSVCVVCDSVCVCMCMCVCVYLCVCGVRVCVCVCGVCVVCVCVCVCGVCVCV